MKTIKKQLFRICCKTEYSINYTYVEADSFDTAMYMAKTLGLENVEEIAKSFEIYSPVTRTITIDI